MVFFSPMFRLPSRSATSFFRVLDGLTVQEGGIREAAWPGIGLVADLELGRVRVLGNDHGLDLELVFAREVEVALIVRGAAEDRASAVIHEDEVGNVNRQFHGRAEGVGRDDAGVVALLLGAVDLFLRRTDLAALLDERHQLRIVLGERLGQRVLGRDADEARAEDRVGPRGEHLDLGNPSKRYRPPALDAFSPDSRKRIDRPWLLPIQLRCMRRTFSGHLSSVSRPASSSSP